MGEMGLHGPRRDAQPIANVFIAQSFANQADDVALGRGQRVPTAWRTLAFASSAARISHRLVGGQGRSRGPGGIEGLLCQRFLGRVSRCLVVGVVHAEADDAGSLAHGVRRAENPCGF